MPTKQVLSCTHPRTAPTPGIRSLGITMSTENAWKNWQLCKLQGQCCITDRQKQGPALQNYANLLNSLAYALSPRLKSGEFLGFEP